MIAASVGLNPTGSFASSSDSSRSLIMPWRFAFVQTGGLPRSTIGTVMDIEVRVLGDPVMVRRVGEILFSIFRLGLAVVGVRRAAGGVVTAAPIICFVGSFSNEGFDWGFLRTFLVGDTDCSATGVFGGTRGGNSFMSSPATLVVGVVLSGGEKMGDKGRVGLNVVHSGWAIFSGHWVTGD